MKITEVRVKIMEDRGDKLQAFCTITLDDAFVIRDLKIIEGSKGVFVAMPSRKLTDRCPKCGGKNHLRAGFCNDCGLRLTGDRAARDDHGRAKLHADIAHPINSATREVLQRMVLDAYRTEVERSKQPGYVAPKLYDDDDYVPEYDDHATPPRGVPRPALGPPASKAAIPVAPPPAAAAAPVKAEGDDFSRGIFG
ncbi:MAG TPA: SpoVG family protein [Planctomycetota bacterium]|nr:SpoVG family protein [Planctomycetota bacterium]